MSDANQTLPGGGPRIGWQFDADVPTQDAGNPGEPRSGTRTAPDEWCTGRTRRLPADSVKQAILHADRRIRETAIGCFSRAYSDDISVMPLVIEAVEKFGRDGAYMLVGMADRLPQTADTLDWLIRELNDPSSTAFENYTYNVQRVLSAADPGLLQACEADIARAEHMTSWAQEIIRQRIEMLSWDSDRCWRELEQHGERYQEAEYGSDARLGQAELTVEALARSGVSEDRLLELLARQVDPHAPTPMRWMEPMLMSLAGHVRLETAIPLLLDKMRLDDDVLLESGRVALIRIGNDSAVRAVADAFAGGEKRFRYVAADVLENIHTDLAVETMFQLLPGETDVNVGRLLRAALLGQFTPDAIEPARRWLLERGFDDWEDTGLRNQLLRVCDVLGEKFPEYEQWRKDEEADEHERLRMLEQMKDNPLGSMIWALEKIAGKKAGEVLQEIEKKEAARAVEAIVEETARPAQVHVGRNDPCPCGSGKKYKKCCLRK